MKKMFLIVLVTFLIVSVVNSTAIKAEQSEPSLTYLSKFVGKYSSGGFDKTGKYFSKGNSLIKDKAFRQVAIKTLGKERFKIYINDLNVEDPIEQKGQILFFRRFMPHNYDYLYTLTFINLADSSMQICWVDDEGQNYWFSSKNQPHTIGKMPDNLKQPSNYLTVFEKYGKQ